MTGSIRQVRDRIVASDPGLNRLRMAGSGVAAMGSAIGVEYLFAVVTHAGAKATLVSMLLGAIVAMMGSMGLSSGSAWVKARTAVFFPVAIGAGMLGGIAVGNRTDLMLGVFVLVMFLAVYVRRFGIPFFFYGFMAWLGYFFASFLHATMDLLPSLLIAVLVGAGWVLLLSVTVLSVNARRTMLRTLRAYGARTRAVARLCAELLEDGPQDEKEYRRWRRKLHARMNRLAEAALMVEGWLGERGALPRGWAAPALRRHLVDVQLAVDSIASSAQALRDGERELVAEAATMLRHLAHAEYPEAGRAANRILDQAEVAEPDRPAGWWPARHLATAVADFVDVARNAYNPPETEPSDDFEPAVMLAMGNLPGSPAVAGDVTPRGGQWNPLTRLSLTTRQAIQAALAGGLAIVLGRLVSEQRYYWAVIAAFIAFTGTATRSETFIKATNRVLGTVAGLLVAIWLANVTDGDTTLVLVVILASMFCGFYLMRVSYAFMIFFVTIMIAQLYTVLHEFSNGLLVLRLEETAIGAACGIVVALVILPVSTRDTVRVACGNLMTTLSELLTAAAGKIDPEHAAAVREETNEVDQPDEADQEDEAAEPTEADLDHLSRKLDDHLRQLILIAAPMTRPVIARNDPRKMRRTLTLYRGVSTYARNLVVLLRREGTPAPSDLAVACTTLAGVATRLAEAENTTGKDAAGALAAELAEADDRLFVAGGRPGAHTVARPLIHLQQLLRELAGIPVPVPRAQRTPAPARAGGASRTHPIPAIPCTRSGPHMTGAVRNAAGHALGAGTVTVTKAGGGQAARVPLDPGGGYRVGALEPGSYVAFAAAPGHHPAASTVTVDGTALVTDFTLQPVHEVAGTVRGPGATGAVPGATVVTVAGDGYVASTVTSDENGHYRLPPLPEGEYTMVVSSPTAAARVPLTAGEDRRLNLFLEAAGDVGVKDPWLTADTADTGSRG